MTRYERIFLAIIVSVAIVIVLGGLNLSIWDGSFALTVKLTSRAPVESVDYVLCFTEEQADLILQMANKNSRDIGWDSSKVNEGAFTVRGRCSGKFYLGVEYGYVQDRYMIIKCQRANQAMLLTKAEIPLGRGPRSIDVAIP